MPQYDMNVHDYFRIIRKQKWIIILTTLAVYISAIAYTKMQTKLYRSIATVEVVEDTKFSSQIFPGATKVPTRKSSTTLNTAEQIIKSKPVAIRVINELGLVSDNASQLEINKIVDELNKRIKVNINYSKGMVQVILESAEPRKATLIVNKVAEAFRIESDKRAQYSEQLVLDYLKEQLAIAKERLSRSERELLNFRNEHALELSRDEKDTVNDINKLKDLISNLTIEKEDLNSQLKVLKAYVMGEDVDITNMKALTEDPEINNIRKQIAASKKEILELSNLYMPNHPKIYVLKEKTTMLNEKFNALIDQKIGTIISNMEKELSEKRIQESEARNKKALHEEEIVNIPVIKLELEKLERTYEVNDELYTMFKKKLEEVRISQAAEIGDVRIVQKAGVPTVPFYPNERRSALAGLMIGLILGFAFAFIVESMDTSIGTIEDVERYIQKPVLGVIPHIKIDSEKVRSLRKRLESAGEVFNERQARLVAICDPKSPVTEAYRTLRTNLQFSLPNTNQGKTILISSATPQEGKTTTLTNLAVIMAQAGKKTVVLSCNLRHPSVYKIFGAKKKPGITDILAGSYTWREAIQNPGIDNLKILSAGPYPPNPSEILQSAEFDNLVNELKQEFDILLFDSPPILPVTDAAVIASKTDAVVLCYFVGKAAREALLRAKIQLENVNSNLVGIVLNDIKSEGKLAYTYYYHYQYKYYGVRDSSEV